MTGRENHTAELKRLRDEERLAILDAYRGPRLVELFARLTGKQPSKVTAREARYGGAGSLWVNLTRGTFRDHEAGVGGGVIKAVEHYIGTDYAGAIRYLRDDLGLPVDGPVPQLSDDDKKKSEAERLALDLADSESERENLERARQIWDGGRHISGTPGYKYLATTRAIGTQATDKLTADIVRWHDAGRYLMFKVTDDAGEFTGIQRIAVTHDGQKDLRWRSGKKLSAKLSLGPIGRGVVRLPGNSSGPLCHAEGPETGLSATAAGFEVHVALGGRLIKPAPGRMTVYLRDDDKRNPKTERTRRQTMRQWRKEGLTFADANPFEQRRGEKQDFNDLLKERGIEAVRDRINLFAAKAAPVPSQFIPIAEARLKLDGIIGPMFDDFVAFNPEEQSPPVYGVKLTVGGGKSHAALKHIARALKAMRAAGDNRVFIYSVPYHDLGEKLISRFKEYAGEGLKAAIWRGRESRKPNASDKDDRMCDRIEDVRLAQKNRVKVGEELCAHCPLKESCAYMAQRHQEGDVWFMAHPAMFGRIPKTIGTKNVAGVIIDETPWQSGIVTDVELPVSLLDAGAMPLPSWGGSLGGERCADIRRRLSLAIEANGLGPMTRKALVSQGIDSDTGRDGQKMERAREVTDGPWQLRTANRTIGPMAMTWRAVEELIESGQEATGRIIVEKDENNATVLVLSGRLSIGEDWQKPTLLIDASLEPDLIREFWPSLVTKAELSVDAPHMTVHQVQGRAFSKLMLAPLLGEPSTDEAKQLARYKARSRRSLRAFILRMDRQNGGQTVAIGNLDIIDALNLPAHIGTAHFNALVGLDDFGGARTIIVIGRTLPGPHIVEDMAAALTGRVIDRLADRQWYPTRDATRIMRTPEGLTPAIGETIAHPDRTAETIRRRICEGEVEQAIGRGRGINRTAADPLDVYLLSDVALDLPIDRFIDPEDVTAPTPFDLMHGEGGIVIPDAPSDASRLYPTLWRNPDAARQAWVRSRSVTLPNKESFLGNVTHLCPITYLRAGPGQRPQSGWFDPRMVADPRAIIEGALGPLARFEVVEQQAEQEAATVPAVIGSAAIAVEPVEDFHTVDMREEAHLPLPILLSAIQGPFATPADWAAYKAAAFASLGRWALAKRDEQMAVAQNDDGEDADEDDEIVEVDSGWWEAMHQRTADAGLRRCDVASGAGMSASDLSNCEAGRRHMTRRKVAAIEAYLASVPQQQGRLL